MEKLKADSAAIIDDLHAQFGLIGMSNGPRIGGDKAHYGFLRSIYQEKMDTSFS